MVRNCASGIGLPDRNIAITKGHCGRIGLHYKIASSNLRTLKAFPFEVLLQPAGSFTYLLKQTIPTYSLSGSTRSEVS